MKLENLAAALARPGVQAGRGGRPQRRGHPDRRWRPGRVSEVVVHLAALAGRAALAAASPSGSTTSTSWAASGCSRPAGPRASRGSCSPRHHRCTARTAPCRSARAIPAGGRCRPTPPSKRAGELIAWNTHHLHGMARPACGFSPCSGPASGPTWPSTSSSPPSRAANRSSCSVTAAPPATTRSSTTLIDGVVAAIDRVVAEASRTIASTTSAGRSATSLAELVESWRRRRLKLARSIVWMPEPPGDMQPHPGGRIAGPAGAGLSRPRWGWRRGLPLVRWWRPGLRCRLVARAVAVGRAAADAGSR